MPNHIFKIFLISVLLLFGSQASAATYNLWPSTATPAVALDTNDTTPNEFGVRFKSSLAGTIDGVRFYKGGTANSGTHTGHLWSSTGTLLASVTFTGETASGWQQALFTTPVAISANTIYVISYFAPAGRNSYSQPYFAGADYVNGPLTAPGNATNGVYKQNATSSFPNLVYLSTNYWVDVVFSTSDTTAPTVSLSAPANNATVSGSAVTVSATATDAVGVVGVQFKLDGVNLNAEDTTSPYSISWNSTTANNGSHVLTAVARDAAGNTTTSSSRTVTVTGGVAGVSFWSSANVPTVIADTSALAVELGLKFKTSVNGNITGIKFYKGSTNTGTHTGHLWSSTGTLLASVTFTGETASGWQQANFATPIAITANTTYVISYFAPVGKNSYDHLYFAGADYVNGTLTALGGAVNGVYKQNATSTFPNLVFQSSNYWVDVVFSATVVPPADTTAPAVSLSAPLAGATVSLLTTVSATASDAVGVVGVQFKLDGVNLGAEDTASPYSMSWDTVTASNGTHVLTAVARDLAGNSATSSSVSVNVNNIVPDTTAPSVPTNLSATAVSQTQINLSWTASTDNTAVTGYKIFRAGTQIATSLTNSYQNTGLTASTNYSYTVLAYDLAGNNSTQSSSANATTQTPPPPPDTTAPTISLTTPTDGATVSGTIAVSANASDNVAVTGVQFKLDGANLGAEDTTSPYSISLDTTTTTNASHTLTAVARDSAGNTTTSSSLTITVVPVASTGYSLWPASAIPNVISDTSTSAVELGVKFKASVGGTITAMRFYKGPTNTGTHTGHLWTSTGTLLSAVTFTNETASGWQQAEFANPVAISANAIYVVSYFASVGRNSYDHLYFSGANDYINGPLSAPGNATNGVYNQALTSNFPNSIYQSTNYWVDVVFSPTSPYTSDTTAPTVSLTAPSSGASVSGSTVTVSANASDNVAVTGVQFKLDGVNLGAEDTISPYSINWNTTTATNGSHTLTAVARDAGGNTNTATNVNVVVNNSSSSLSDGPGGPILIITSGTNLFSTYYAEILRNEGFNEFFSKDISLVNSTLLNSYDTVILGEMSLSSTQVTMLNNWVTAGGNLIAMRPDKQLAGLLGITDQSTQLSNAYLLVDTSASPGTGIVNQTIQFHGTADRYTLNGATAVATLYSSATASTSSPAITLKSVGSNGGQVASFTYDLAKSIVYTRQGNPAWVGQLRDTAGLNKIGTYDLFIGNGSPDWVDLNKVQIPQADEQQRLLGNLITTMTLDKKPLPHFWYLPNMKKAVILAAGDDHATANGTPTIFNMFDNASPANCSVDDWECYRATSWIYTSISLTNSQALAYQTKGFDIGVHVNTNCADWTPATLESFFANDLNSFASKYFSLPPQDGNRTHCITWSDWGSTPVVERNHNIRIDMSYYYWPSNWVNNRMGLFTGSGMPMRYAQLDGSMTDVYQATSQLVNENGVNYPAGINLLLDNALGPQGYYGIFGTHYDYRGDGFESKLLASAQSHGVSIVTAHQVLTWLDGRNNSSFNSLAWNNNVLTFGVTLASGAQGAYALLPHNGSQGPLTSLTLNGSPVSVTTETIKGIAYDEFLALPGSYVASYAGGTPVVPVNNTPPANTGNVYNVGASGSPYQTINSVPWASLSPGATVNIYPGIYHEKLIVMSSGTANNWIKVVGMPGAIIDGANATYTGTADPTWIAPSFGVGPARSKYVEISDLEIRNFNTNGIYIVESQHIRILRNNIHDNNGNGIIAVGNWTANEDLYIGYNTITNNGVVGSYLEHNSYTESDGLVFVGNKIGKLKSGASGSAFKDRSTKSLIFDNEMECASRCMDLVAVESPAVDGLVNPATTYSQVYGNIIINNGTAGNMIHLSDEGKGQKQGHIPFNFYNNTFVANFPTAYWRPAFFQVDPVNNATGQTQVVTATNNIFLMNGNINLPSFMSDGGILNFTGKNLVTANIPCNNDRSSAVCNNMATALITDTKSDANFVNATGGDYHLVSTSQAVNSAGALPSNVAVPVKEYPDVTRADIFDIGAFDYAGTSSPAPVNPVVPVVDPALPVLSNVAYANTTVSSATITWTTDKASNSKVNFGTTSAYGLSSPLSATMLLSHSVALYNLKRNTTYYYQVVSQDALGNTAKSAPMTFTTVSRLAKPPKITPSVKNGSVILSWVMPVDDDGVTYEFYAGTIVMRSTQAYIQTLNLAQALVDVKSPLLTYHDTEVTDGTTYYYTLFAYDDQGNYSDPSFVSFTPTATASAGGGGGGSSSIDIGGSSGSGGGGIITIPATATRPKTISLPPTARKLDIPADFKFAKMLRFNQKLADIYYLQIVLNQDPATKIATAGPGSPGQETLRLGPLSTLALIKFQEKYAGEILTPFGLTQGTGIVGPKTQAKLNQLLVQLRK